MLNKCGIYKITNNITNQFYIGCSKNIDKRWKDHKRDYKYLSNQYSKPLYISMRKHGIEKFSIEIIEECEKEFLLDRELYYIKSLKAVENGYNAQALEKHNKAALKIKDVIDIRNRYNNKERKYEVYKDYQKIINKTGFHKIWNGYTWPSIMKEVFTLENIQFHKHNTANKGSKNGTAKLDEEDVINIRTYKKNNYSKKFVYEMYKDKVTKGSFTNIWCGYNWKHIVI